jgi:GH25 family lysozyme M1 (1,4-beta-N-acetylmuramidase)
MNAGFKPMVYTNPNFIKNRLNDISKWDLWLAYHTSKTEIPTEFSNMQIWQWGISNVDGIFGNVDSNYGFFKLDNEGWGKKTI